MSTRNRGGYSNRKSGRSGGGTAVRQAGAILMLGALSFVLGFFVLSRFVPAGHSPDSPMSASPNGENNREPRSEQIASGAPAASHERNPPPHPHPAANTPRPTIDPAPSIDPAEDGPTQQPASIDASPDEKRSSNAEKAAARENKSASDLTQPNSRESDAAQAAADGPAPPRRRRRRRPASTAAENKGEKQAADANAIQRPSSLDDPGEKGASGDKGDQGDGGDGNN